ncbi:MAG: hypothetical protein QGI83_01760, partial [Candidatus Latescibacteria bacterium]|nr:hypothetical protein [Candidatus Latescibacterota bacterium]
MSFLSPGIQILSVSQGMMPYQIQGALLVLFGLLPLAMFLAAHLRTQGSPPGSGQNALLGSVADVGQK